MKTARLEAFSDGVIAIIITIMVLEMKAPTGTDLASLAPLLPVFLSYVLSFLYVGIYWSNHHHMFHAVKNVNGAILWANLHLLFWLSLFPFVTRWVGENHFPPVGMALYGVVLLMAALAYWIIQKVIIAHEGRDSTLATALGSDLKGNISPLFYMLAIPASFYSVWIAGGLYVLVALIWLVPDRRIERALAARRDG